MSRLIRTHAFTLKKTVSYCVTHITVASLVAYAVTGDLVVAFTLSLLEPTVQAVVYFFHERLWQRAAMPAPAVTQPAPVMVAVGSH